MKFFFLKTDSLYKILKTLEKIPPQKPVEIFIDPEHSFFDNMRWGKQVQTIIQQRNLIITFIAENPANRNYFLQLGLQVQQQEERLLFRLLKTASLFFFNFKKFHLHAYNQQKYLFYFVFGSEIIAGLGLLWFFALLILPSANITLKVAQNKEDIIYNFRYYPAQEQSYQSAIKQISIPYYTGMINYQYSLAITTENIHHITNPSAGLVKIYNSTEKEINLIPNTKFVTEEGLIFQTPDQLILPAGTAQIPSETRVKLFAMENDENGLIMGVRGNIPAKTSLRIKNLKESFYLDQVRAESIENFTGGSNTSLGLISEKDHQLLKEKIQAGIYKDKLSIVQKEFKEKKALILLFDPLIKTSIHNIDVDAKVGDKATSLKGSAKVSYAFLYLQRDDLLKAFSTYVTQRQSDSIQLISIDPQSLNFLSNASFLDEKVFSIPTKISILQGYDFDRDIKGIRNAIKNKVVGMTLEEARKYILSFPEIASTKIGLGLFGGNSIPTIKSRVHIQVDL